MTGWLSACLTPESPRSSSTIYIKKGAKEKSIYFFRKLRDSIRQYYQLDFGKNSTEFNQILGISQTYFHGCQIVEPFNFEHNSQNDLIEIACSVNLLRRYRIQKKLT